MRQEGYSLMIESCRYHKVYCRSHTVWWHPDLDDELALSGGDGYDAKIYQEKDVREILRKLKEVQREQ